MLNRIAVQRSNCTRVPHSFYFWTFHQSTYAEGHITARPGGEDHLPPFDLFFCRPFLLNDIFPPIPELHIGGHD